MDCSPAGSTVDQNLNARQLICRIVGIAAKFPALASTHLWTDPRTDVGEGLGGSGDLVNPWIWDDIIDAEDIEVSLENDPPRLDMGDCSGAWEDLWASCVPLFL